jgi:ribosomal-protein-alanine N-acetyltransferase
VLYRLYKPEDFAALYAIEEACFQPPLRFSRTYMRQLIGQTNAATWIAEDGARVCGFGLVEWTLEDAQLAAYIQTIEVIPEARGQGVGEELMRRMESSANAAGASSIWLHVDARNVAAIRLYERHGYHCRGRQEGYYGLGVAALIYDKALLPVSPSQPL